MKDSDNGDIKNSLSKLVFTHPVCVRYCCRHHITNDKLDLCLLMGVKTKCTWNYKKIPSYCVIHLYTSIPWRSLFIHLFYKVWENRQSLYVIRASVTLKVNKTECTVSSTSRRTAAQVYLPVLPPHLSLTPCRCWLWRALMSCRCRRLCCGSWRDDCDKWRHLAAGVT